MAFHVGKDSILAMQFTGYGLVSSYDSGRWRGTSIGAGGQRVFFGLIGN